MGSTFKAAVARVLRKGCNSLEKLWNRSCLGRFLGESGCGCVEESYPENYPDVGQTEHAGEEDDGDNESGEGDLDGDSYPRY